MNTNAKVIISILVVLVLVMVGVVVKQSQINPADHGASIGQYTPNPGEGPKLSGWVVETIQLDQTTSIISDSLPQTINACDQPQTKTYTCTGKVSGSYAYGLKIDLAIGTDQTVSVMAGLSPEVYAQIGEERSKSVSRSWTVDEGTIQTINVTYFDFIKNGYGVVYHNVDDITVNGNFTHFTGSCDIQIELVETQLCNPSAPPVVAQSQDSDESSVVVQTPQPNTNDFASNSNDTDDWVAIIDHAWLNQHYSVFKTGTPQDAVKYATDIWDNNSINFDGGGTLKLETGEYAIVWTDWGGQPPRDAFAVNTDYGYGVFLLVGEGSWSLSKGGAHKYRYISDSTSLYTGNGFEVLMENDTVHPVRMAGVGNEQSCTLPAGCNVIGDPGVIGTLNENDTNPSAVYINSETQMNLRGNETLLRLPAYGYTMISASNFNLEADTIELHLRQSSTREWFVIIKGESTIRDMLITDYVPLSTLVTLFPVAEADGGFFSQVYLQQNVDNSHQSNCSGGCEHVSVVIIDPNDGSWSIIDHTKATGWSLVATNIAS